MPDRLHDSIKELYGGKKLLILGFGREGRSTARVLHEAFPGARFGVMDKAAVDLADFPFLDLQGTYMGGLENFDAVFKTAGVPAAETALQEYRKKGGVITSQLNEFLRVYAAQTIGVTGTKGKSTTSALLSEMLRAAGNRAVHGGNIGVPPFALTRDMGPEAMAVLEMSSYQLETVAFSPHIAVLLNVFPEHLDYHGSLDSYLEAKKNITRFQEQTDLLFYDGSFPALTEIAVKTKAWAINYSSAEEISALEIFADDLALLPEIAQTKNAPPAIAVARRLGVSDLIISRVIRGFRTLPHRLERVGSFRDIVFYDDTLATVPQATVAAIDSIRDIDIIIVGGFDRGIECGIVAEKIVRSHIPHVIAFPTTGEKIASLIRAETTDEGFPSIDKAADMETAVRKCYELLPRGGTVLLSPAAPSFGLFKDYEDKSSQYIFWIKKLAVQES